MIIDPLKSVVRIFGSDRGVELPLQTHRALLCQFDLMEYPAAMITAEYVVTEPNPLWLRNMINVLAYFGHENLLFPLKRVWR